MAPASTVSGHLPEAQPVVPNDWKRVILWGGLAIGTLDAADGVIAYAFLGQNPIQVLQYIASGALGSAAFSGGLSTAALGAVLHFFIAFVVATVFYAAAKRLPFLLARPILYGLLFGAAVYLFMTFLVLPLSGTPKRPFSLGLFLNGIIGHALFIGLPLALLARRSADHLD